MVATPSPKEIRTDALIQVSKAGLVNWVARIARACCQRFSQETIKNIQIYLVGKLYW